jgi:hypothetical protein
MMIQSGPITPVNGTDLKQFIEQTFKPLAKKVENLEKENARLVDRVCELEDQVEELTEKIRKMERAAIEADDAKRDEEPDASWLFYCPGGVQTSKIIESLGLRGDKIIEFDCASWTNEVELWLIILKSLKADIGSIKNPTPETLKILAESSFAPAFRQELLMIMRGLPKVEADLNKKLQMFSTVCESITRTWKDLEAANNPDLLGRIAVVLESERRLDAISLDKGDIRLVLYVEPLKIV